MKSLYIIGDSHTFRLRNNSDPRDALDYCFWGTTKTPTRVNSECKEYHIDKLTNPPKPFKDIFFSGHRGCSGYSAAFLQDCPCIKKPITENTIVMPFFGYIDVKIHLPKYKNPEEAAEVYVEKMINFFDNCQIHFIEPIPQFINRIGTGFPLHTFETRYPLHQRFVKALRKICAEKNLKEPISPEKFFNVDKFDESYECHDCESCNAVPDVKLDHLKPEINQKLFKYILDQVRQQN